MLFNSAAYAIFLPITVLLYFVTPHRFRWAVLLALSYYFYMSWNAKLIWLILFTTATSYISARLIDSTANKKYKKIYMTAGVAISLACLFFFKYFNFFSNVISDVASVAGLQLNASTLKLILPVGISFYTFQTLSYVIDVYRGRMKAEKHFGIFALYVSFFPQLVAGPIERATNLLPQFYRRHTFDTARVSQGLRLMGVGFIKKVVIADTVAVYVNNVYNNVQDFTGLSLILATLLFAVQIYCDFGGYSDIAIGTAKILGFDLMKNFTSPYFAKSVREFWRRWHISLSTWFTDYVYIPLGGSRVKKAKHLRNLVVTFLLSGLWHGAEYTFVIWGILHGLVLCAETFYMPHIEKWSAKQSTLVQKICGLARWGYTFAIVNAGWILFRANSLGDAMYIFANLPHGLNIFKITYYAQFMGISLPMLCIIALLVALLMGYDAMDYHGIQPLEKLKTVPKAVRYTVYWLMGMAILVTLYCRPIGATADFIYFQF